MTIIVIQPVLQALFEPNTMQTMQVPGEDVSFQLKEWFFKNRYECRDRHHTF